MTRREKLEEQYEDALFALLMDDIADEEGKALLEENERLKHDPSAAIPEELDKKCRKIIRNTFRKEQGRTFGRISFRIFQRVAVVAVLAALLFTVAYAVVPEFQVAVKNMVLVLTETNISTNMGLRPYNDNPNGRPSSYVTAYSLPQIQEGYVLVEEYNVENSDYRGYWYDAPDGNHYTIDIEAGNETSVVAIDTEDAQSVEDIVINGYSGICVHKNGTIQIAWADTDRSIFISVYASALPEDQVIEMAQAIKYVAPLE